MTMLRLRLENGIVLILLGLLLLFEGACGGGSIGGQAQPTPSPAPTATSQPVTQYKNVFLVVEENHSFSEVVGNTSMPYLNSLISNYGLATQYFANTHPSIGNYFVLTTGTVVTNNEAVPPATVTANNVVREVLAANKTWKSYAESLPSVGYVGGDQFPYAQHHNPFVFLQDAIDPTQVNNIVPFTQFATDLAANQLPNFSFIVPNQLNNAHDGTLAEADLWLHKNIDPLIKSPSFQKDGLLIITFDESDFSDLQHGGGHIATVVVSAHAKKGFRSTKFYQHESTLREMLHALGISTFPGNAANVPDMDEFF
jgi:phosphatidylinositol-3-phosphatase